MEYKKIINILVVLNLLILIFIAVVSFRFLNDQIKKTKEVDPEILSQYTTVLESSKFLQLKKQIINNSP